MILRSRTIIFLILLIDLALLTVAYAIVGKLHYGTLPVFSNLFSLLLISWTATYLFFLNLGFFDVKNVFTRTARLLKKFFIFVSIGSVSIILFDMDDASRTMFLGTSLCFLALEFPATYFYTYLISIRKYGPYYNKVLVIGAGKIGEAIQLYYRMNPESGKLIGFLDDTKVQNERFSILGEVSDFQQVFNEHHFNEVIITINLSKEKEIKTLVNLAEYNGVRPSIVANYYSLFNRNFELKNFEGIPIVSIREVPLDPYTARFWKRVFDLVFSIFALIVLFPAFLGIAIAIKLESKGPVFYRPIRVGKHGAEISVFKFRSMRVSTNAEDQLRSTKVGDERITRVGRFIRKYSLDELPQFINVVIGDMSVVGPRPHRIDLNKRFQQTVQSYLVRQYIKPGITGWAQVNGWRGPTETKYQYIARTLHDLWYIEHWNFALDVYIIFLTIFGTKTRKNAF
jgi:putative colanic acid biosynthesis UDP-glucose lipid carrier transferase